MVTGKVNLAELYKAMSKEEQREFANLILQEIWIIQDELSRKFFPEAYPNKKYTFDKDGLTIEKKEG